MLGKVNLPPVPGAAQLPDPLTRRRTDVPCHASMIGLAFALYVAHTLFGVVGRHERGKSMRFLGLCVALALLVGAVGAPAQSTDSKSSQSVAALKKQAASGDAEAQYYLGMTYLGGFGVPPDYTKAAAWMRKAAEQGLVSAQWTLGGLYEYGTGVPQDYAQAAVWYRKAAEQGSAGGQFHLGVFYAKGQGVPQDYAEAYFWFDLAAAGNCATLTRCLGVDAPKAVEDRDNAASHLMPADLSRVQERARKWFEDHPAKANPQ